MYGHFFMSANVLKTTSHLLSALNPHTNKAEWWQDGENAGIDWHDLAIRAIVFGLAPQLYHRLTGWEITLPPRAHAKLAVTYQAQAKRSESIYTQLGEILAACKNANLNPVVLKGAHLAAVYYAAPALRPMNDIDMLFPTNELADAENMLASLAYGGKHKSSEIGAGVTKHTSTFKRDGAEANTSNPYLSAEGERMIEPHGSLEESWYGLKVDITPGIRERCVPAKLQGHLAKVLSPEDVLIHVALHFTFHLIQGAPSMVQLTDVLTISETARLDWHVVADRAVEYEAAPYVLAGLLLAEKLLGAKVPAFVRNALSRHTPQSLRDHIENLNLNDVLRRTQQKPITSMGDRLKRGIADRAETAKWASDIQGKWQVWKTALNITKTDAGQMLLRKDSKEKIP
jgi:hypothetical protein